MRERKYLVIQVEVTDMTDYQVNNLRYAMIAQVEGTQAESNSGNDSIIVLEPVLT